MMSSARNIWILFFLFVCVQSEAQTVFQPKPVEYNLKGVVYDFETLFEGRIHTQGFAFALKKGKLKNYYKTTYQNFEIGYIKDHRERRFNKNISLSGERLSSPFIYGKQNQFFTLRYSYGVKRFLSEKTRRRGLAVGLVYEGGVTLGLLKPYSLKIIRRDDDDPTQQMIETVQYSDEVREDFLNERFIYGGAGFFNGWNSITPTVGLHGKIAMHWALGAFDEKAKAFETGLMVDIFPRKIPILIEQETTPNSFYYFKIYIAFQFGKRKRIGEE